MKYVLPISVLTTLILSASLSFAQTDTSTTTTTTGTVPGSTTGTTVTTPTTSSDASANSSASNEQTTDYVMGGVSIAGGGAAAAYFCPTSVIPVHAMYCAAGIMAAAEGLQNVLTAAGRSSSIDPTSADGGISTGTTSGSGNCGDSANCTSGSTSGTVGGTTGTLPAAVQQAINQAAAAAQQAGVDLANPQSVSDFAASHGMGGASGGGGISSLPPEAQDIANKAAKEFLANYKVSAVGVEDGGGGGGGGGGMMNGKEDNSDLAAMLDQLNGKNRGPASVEGLQKNINGEPVGVKTDNIFHQMTRRYQVKIQRNTFLPAATASATVAPSAATSNGKYKTRTPSSVRAPQKYRS